MNNRLSEGLANGEFVVTCEMIPGRGASTPNQQKMLEESEKLFATGKVHAVSITDNPGGNPALSAETFAQEMMQRGITPLVHMSCKDRSRNTLMSALYTMERCGIENVLTMTGDYPVSGWSGMSRPVFDIDPVQLLQMIDCMNSGLKITNAGEAVPAADAKSEEPTHFFAGCCVSPFKYNEGELIPQYLKLNKKLHAGAKFVISQVGYDARKMQELILYMQEQGYGDIPAIANIYVLGYGASRFMNRGGIPGCFASDELVATLKAESDSSDDKGKEARNVRAAKMIAVAKGMGYRGCHIGSPGLTCEQVLHILDMADQFAPTWKDYVKELTFPKENGYYYFEADNEDTGLNLTSHTPRAEYHNERAVQKNYALSRFAHRNAFTPEQGFFGILHNHEVNIEKRYDEKLGKGNGFRHPHGVEHIGKTFLYHCIDCGDCGLYACAYVCPMSQCPKCQRNGPCGGSSDGWCEVYPGVQRCIYYRAYYRLKKYGEEMSLGDWIIPPNNWTSWQASPWGGYHHGRDNINRRERITPWREGEHKEKLYQDWKYPDCQQGKEE